MGPEPRRNVPPNFVVCVLASNSLERELGMEPFPKRGSLGYLGLIEVGLRTHKEVQVNLGDEEWTSVTLGFLNWVAGKPAILQNPNQM